MEDEDDDLADESRLLPAKPKEGSRNLSPWMGVTVTSDLPAKGPRQIKTLKLVGRLDIKG